MTPRYERLNKAWWVLYRFYHVNGENPFDRISRLCWSRLCSLRDTLWKELHHDA